MKKSNDRLLELRYSSGCGNDSTTEPKGHTQTEASPVRDRDEFFDLIDEPLAALGVAMEGVVDLLDVPSYQSKLGLYRVSHWPVIHRRHAGPQLLETQYD
jgi:hypothetical protein